MIERFDPKLRERHIEVHATAELVALDTSDQRTDALRGLHDQHRREARRQSLGQEGGEESSVGPDLGEAGCQVNTLLVQSGSRPVTHLRRRFGVPAICCGG